MMFANELPPGRYYIGDPCYVIRDSWDDVLTKTRYFNYFRKDTLKYEDGVNSTEDQATAHDYRGHRLAASGTAHGDGLYESNIGFEFAVDAGLLGAVPVELMEVSEEDVERRELGTIVEFKRKFDIAYEDGTVRIGDIEIYTEEQESYTDECHYCGFDVDECECE